MSTPDSERRRAGLRLIDIWHHRARKMEKSHYASATTCRNLNYLMGVPLVVITTVIASDLFGVLQTLARTLWPFEPQGERRVLAWIVVVMSLMAPVLAALQTFLRFPERAEQHRGAAVKFGNLKRELEELHTFPPVATEEIEARLHAIQVREAQIVEESPTCSTLALRNVRKELEREAEEERGARAVPPLAPLEPESALETAQV